MYRMLHIYDPYNIIYIYAGQEREEIEVAATCAPLTRGWRENYARCQLSHIKVLLAARGYRSCVTREEYVYMYIQLASEEIIQE